MCSCSECKRKQEIAQWDGADNTLLSWYCCSLNTTIFEERFMRKVFWENPYQSSLTTTVTAVNGVEILFDATIAYSFAGGQESDRAWVNGIEILGSRMDSGLIYYTLPPEHGLNVGAVVLMTIDWPRRYRLMRLHFTAELMLELVTQKYGLEKVGAHIAEHKSRIDFKSDINISAYFPDLLADYEAIIAADYPIEKGYSDVAAQRRYWKIDGFAQVPCGGTHVRSTAEVGMVTLKRDRPGKGIERIEIRLVEPDKIERIMTTERLILRLWKPEDAEPYYEMHQDPKVIEFLPGPLSRERVAEFMADMNAGFAVNKYCMFAVEEQASGAFIGFVGLAQPRFEAHFTPCVEIGWRLASAYWGRGYATEVARAVLAYAFNFLKLDEVVSFTVPKNVRSQNVMRRIGMVRDENGDFLHPKLPADHRLAQHVLYRIKKVVSYSRSNV
jgi:Ser-tRNA(Ala) deacylase AlaX/predicted acetyltransferase